MKASWEIKKLGEVCDFQNGFAFKSNLFRETGNAILRISNIQNEKIETSELVYFHEKDYKENFDRYRVIKGDLLIAMSGATTGKIGFNTTDDVFYLNQRVGLFKPKKSLEKSYLFYFLSTRVEENLRISAGAAQPNLSTEQIKSLEIPLPPLPEQRRIVTILDQAFEGIAKATANAEKNLANARELFDDYLNVIVASHGEGWEKTKLCEIAEYFNGLTYSPKDVADKGIIVLRSSNVQNDELDFSDVVRVNLSVKDKIKVKDGDILMCSRNGSKRLVGKTATIKNLNEEMTFGTFMMIIRSPFNHYLSWFFKSKYFRAQIASGENTMINQITRYMLDDVSLNLPPTQLQSELAYKLDELFAETKQLEAIYQQKLDALDELKKSILNQAFSGQLN